jgi:hypothetical protein
MVARRPSLPALIGKHHQQISISDEKPILWRPLVPPFAHLPGHRFNLEQAIEAIPTSPCHTSPFVILSVAKNLAVSISSRR